jgi:hypothetical protein
LTDIGRPWAAPPSPTGIIRPAVPSARGIPGPLPAAALRLMAVVASVATAVVVWAEFTIMGGMPVDAWCFYDIDPAAPYWKAAYQFLYSPAAAQVMAVARLVPFEAFVAIVRAAEIAVTLAITGPFFPLVVFWSPLASEFNAANINMLIVGVAIWGVRRPALWSFVVLTKVTPGIGLVWFLVRGEWRSLAIASAATLMIATASFVVAPGLWPDWIAFLTTIPPSDGVPLWARVAAATTLVAWGARTDRRWTLVIAVTIAMPRLYLMTPAMLVGLLYFLPLRTRFALKRPNLRARADAVTA